MKDHIKQAALTAVLSAALLLSGCGGKTSAADIPAASAEATAVGIAVQMLDTGALFSDRDLRQDYDEAAAVKVSLNGDTAACTSDAVSVDGGRVTLLDEGVYILSGTLYDGQVVVNAGNTDKVQIVLSGADITSASSAAIYCLEADKVFITLAEGTENALSNGGTFTAIDDNNIDAAVFSKTDLTLNGAGSLTVTSPAGHGIVSKDELTITGGAYSVTADRHGLSGKDGVAVAGGTFAITSGKDGIHAENADDASRGTVYLADGDFTINAQGDAISAGGSLQIDGGSYALTTGGGSASVTMQRGDSMQHPGFKVFPPAEAPADTAEDTESCKGIKADGAVTVSGGTFVLDTADDTVHGGGDVIITGGTWTIRTGDDGIHADAAVVVRAGTFIIPYCYEGVEGQSVTIDGGSLDITCNGNGNTAIDTDGTFTHNGGDITTNDGSESGNGGMGGHGGTRQSKGERPEGEFVRPERRRPAAEQ